MGPRAERPPGPPTPRSERDLGTEYVAPADELEAELAALWSDLLRVVPVGVDDDFFELGGHSLMGAELLRQVQSRLGVLVPARTLYLEPTIAALAAAIRSLSAVPAADHTQGRYR